MRLLKSALRLHAALRGRLVTIGQLATRTVLSSLGLLSVTFSVTTDAVGQFSTSGVAQVSFGVGGTAPEASKQNSAPAMPYNGTFVVFASLAGNLTAGTHFDNTSPTYNIYRKDKNSFTTELISARPDGKAPRKVGGSNVGAELFTGANDPAVSDVAEDGSFAIAFTSDANDLLGDGNYLPPFANTDLGPAQVYIRIFRPNQPARTFLVSEEQSSTGSLSGQKRGTNGRGDQPTISRYAAQHGTISHLYTVCFRSKAGNFRTAGAGPLETSTIYCLRGIGFNETGEFNAGEKLPPLAPPFAEPPGALGHSKPQLSRDGSTLAFVSDVTVLSDRPSVYSTPRKQVYSLSFPSGTPSLLSFRDDGLPASGNSDDPSLSYDGTFVAFTYAPTITDGASSLKGFSPSLSFPFFVRYTRNADGYQQINTTATGAGSDGGVFSGRLEDSGRYAVFSDNGANMSNSMDPKAQVFFKDIESTEEHPGGPLVIVSDVGAGILGNQNSGTHPSPPMTNNLALGSFYDENGQRVFMAAFTSLASNFGSIGQPGDETPFIFSSDISGSFGDPPPDTPTPTATPTPTPQASLTPTTPAGTPTAAPIVDEPQRLVPNAPIAQPPRIEVLPINGGKRFDITVFCQLFVLDPAFGSKAEFLALAAAGARLTYSVEIRRAGSRQRLTRASSRNVVTVRKLEPGRYTVRYRVSAKVGKKTIKSRTSPPAAITLS